MRDEQGMWNNYWGPVMRPDYLLVILCSNSWENPSSGQVICTGKNAFQDTCGWDGQNPFASSALSQMVFWVKDSHTGQLIRRGFVGSQVSRQVLKGTEVKFTDRGELGAHFLRNPVVDVFVLFIRHI